MDIYRNNFEGNNANISGGAIKWNDVEPYSLSKNSFSNNYA